MRSALATSNDYLNGWQASVTPLAAWCGPSGLVPEDMQSETACEGRVCRVWVASREVCSVDRQISHFAGPTSVST